MQNNNILTTNGINILLKENRLNTKLNIDMYFQLIKYNLLNQQNNLYLCTLKDNNNSYDRFILKASKKPILNDIIHLTKISIIILNGKRQINCLKFENINYNEYLKKLNESRKIQEEKERKLREEFNKKKIEEERRKKLEEESRKKKLEEEFKKKKIEEEMKQKKVEEELNKKRIEEELKKKKIEEDINKKRVEEESEKKKIEEKLLKQKMEEELRIKQQEEEKSIFFKEELNNVTKLALKNLKHEERNKRYNFKWEKGNLKWVDLSGKLSDLLSEEDEKEKNFDFDFSSDTSEANDNEIINIKKDKEKPVINDKKEENKILIEEENENEDKKEVEDIFDGIDIKELFKINKKQNRSKKLQQEFELIINLSTKNYKKPIYVKCIRKRLLIHKKYKEYLYYLFRDSDGAEINAFTYGKHHIQNLDKKIELNGVYIISKYKVKPLLYAFQIGGNYRLIIDSYTIIEPMPQDSVFNNIHFHFLTLGDIFFFKEGCVVDICGIIYDEGEPRYYNMKNGQNFMRDIIIGDSSMKKIIVTLYEPHSKDTRIKVEKGEILAVKYGKIGTTATKMKKIYTIGYTILQNSTGDYDKDVLLKDFYEKNPDIDKFQFIFHQEDYKYLNDIKSIMEQNSEHKVTSFKQSFVTKAYVENFRIDEKSLYKGCPLCSKKLIETEDSKYECFQCNKTFTKPKLLFKLILAVRDANAHAFFTLLGIKAVKILEAEPELVKQYLDEGNFRELENLEKKVLFHEYIFTVTMTSFVNNKNGKIMHNININNMEKADGDNLKRIIQLVQN